MYVYVYVCMYIFVCMYVCVYVCMYIFVCMYVCVYVHTYVRTYIHTYIHAYVRMYGYVLVLDTNVHTKKVPNVTVLVRTSLAHTTSELFTSTIRNILLLK